MIYQRPEKIWNSCSMILLGIFPSEYIHRICGILTQRSLEGMICVFETCFIRDTFYSKRFLYSRFNGYGLVSKIRFYRRILIVIYLKIFIIKFLNKVIMSQLQKTFFYFIDSCYYLHFLISSGESVCKLIKIFG